METNKMNMRPAPKKSNSNGLIGGALGAAIGTAVGATFGVGGAYAYNRLSGEEFTEPEIEITDTDILEEPTEEVTVVNHHHHTTHVHVVTPQPEPDPIPEPEPEPIPEPEPTPEPDSTIQVVSYQRVTLDDGSQVDMAVVNYQGQEIAIVDMDLDGWADAMIADTDGNGQISEDEFMAIPEGQSIQMAPLAQAVNYTPDATDPIGGDGGEVVIIDGDDPETDDELIEANNTGSDGIPDYVNNGDVSDLSADAYYASNDTPIDDGGADLTLV